MAQLQEPTTPVKAEAKPQWDGVESSLRFMRRAFTRVFSAVDGPDQPPKHLRELIEQALLDVAHTVDAKLDGLNARHEQLAARLETMQRGSEAAGTAAAHEHRQADEEALDVFAQCVKAVKAEVQKRKEAQSRKPLAAETQPASAEKPASPDRAASPERQASGTKGVGAGPSSNNYIYLDDSAGQEEGEDSLKLLTLDKLKILELFLRHDGVDKALEGLLSRKPLEHRPTSPAERVHLGLAPEPHADGKRMIYSRARGRNTFATTMNI